MEINKKELRKISRRFRTLASNVMNAYFGEQTDALIEFIDYVKGTSLIFDYVESLAYDIEGLESAPSSKALLPYEEAILSSSDSNPSIS